MLTMKTNYFYGNKVSDYGIENGYVDYGTLAKAFDAVLNNSIMEKTMDIGCWEQKSGFINNEDEIEELKEQIGVLEGRIRDFEYATEEEIKELNLSEDEEIEKLEKQIEELETEIKDLEDEQENYYPEVYQYYIVSDNGANLLEEINEIVFYNEELDMYVWGVTHWGTSWSYVLTDIKIENDDN